MKRLITVITIVTVCVTLAGFSALAAGKALQTRQPQAAMNQRKIPEKQMDQRMGPQGRMPDDTPEIGGLGLNWKNLDLTDEQRTKIKELAQDGRENIADLRKDLRDAQQDLRDEMAEEMVDQARIDKLLQEIADLKSQLAEATTQGLLAIKGMLTPEQLEKLADAKAEREAKDLLSDDLRNKIAEINKTAQETIQTLRDELRDLRDQFQDLLIAEDTDQEQLKAVQEQMAAKEGALEKAQVDRVLQIKAVLTPDQFKQFQRMQKQRNQPEAPMQNFQGPGQMMPRQGFQEPQGFQGRSQQQQPQGQLPGRRR